MQFNHSELTTGDELQELIDRAIQAAHQSLIQKT